MTLKCSVKTGVHSVFCLRARKPCVLEFLMGEHICMSVSYTQLQCCHESLSFISNSEFRFIFSDVFKYAQDSMGPI